MKERKFCISGVYRSTSGCSNILMDIVETQDLFLLTLHLTGIQSVLSALRVPLRYLCILICVFVWCWDEPTHPLLLLGAL